MSYSPEHTAFDAQLFPDMSDHSNLEYGGFDDVLNVDSHHAFLDDASPHSAGAYGFAASMAASAPPMNAFASNGAFVHNHPDIWLDQNTWINPNADPKEALNLNPNFDSSTLSGSHIDYGFLAGENNGLLGVGESATISSVSPSISGSQACFSDLLFSSPSAASSPQTFNVGESAVEGQTMFSTPRHTPSFEGRSRTVSMSSSHAPPPNKAGDEAVFKAPTVPASATSRARGRRASPMPYQPSLESSDSSSLFSVQDSLNHFQFSPRPQYQEESPLSSGVFTSPQSIYPSLISQQPYSHSHPQHSSHTPPYPLGLTPAPHSTPSPATSQNSSVVWNTHPGNPNTQSPYYGQAMPWTQQPMRSSSRPPSLHSAASQGSTRHGSVEVDEDGKERAACPYPDCGKFFKDIRAHMLTHQNERPEKCPITSCEFHKRGFARKYDRNRHLVTTHCKATIVCGFCPGSGSSAEKSFNRTDMFKRHLVSHHHVDQTPSNSKKKSPRSSARQSPSLPEDVSGKCSTCNEHFASPQSLFDHFDDCVLRFVTQTDPAEETNEKNLLSVAEDTDVKATMERHSLANDNGSYSTPSAIDDEEYDSDDVEETITSSRAARSGKGAIASHKSHSSGASLHTVANGHVTKNRASSGSKVSAGLTYSKGGVTLAPGKGRKKRKYYPQSWGCATDQMKLKKRVLCVFDGQRRLCKDDMMLSDDLEVRLQLPNSTEGAYVTDLDVETLKRADAFHGATEEERGPWIPSNYPGDWSLAQQQLTA